MPSQICSIPLFFPLFLSLFVNLFCVCANNNKTTTTTKGVEKKALVGRMPAAATMQFTIEWTNLTEMLIGRQNGTGAAGKWGWRKMKAEGKTGKGEEEDRMMDLEEIFPPQRGNTSKISAIVAVNVIPRGNKNAAQPQSTPPKSVQKVVVLPTAITTTTGKATVLQTTTTFRLIPSTTTKSTISRGNSMSSTKKTTKMVMRMMPSPAAIPTTPSSSSATQLPFRLHFLLTRRVRPLMIWKKKTMTTLLPAIRSPQSKATILHHHPILTTASTPPHPHSMPKVTLPMAITTRRVPIGPQVQPGKQQVFHDIDDHRPQPVPIVPSSPGPVQAPGLSPNPPGTLPMDGANQGGGCERREIDGETRWAATIGMNAAGMVPGGGGTSPNCAANTDNRPMPLPPAPSQNGLQKSPAAGPMGVEECCRASTTKTTPRPNVVKCCRPKCSGCPIKSFQSAVSTLPNSLLRSSPPLLPTTPMPMIVLPVPPVWEKPEKHQGLGFS